MKFAAGEPLWLLIALGILAIGSVVVESQRSHYAARFTSLKLLPSVALRHPSWRRHLAARCLLLALVGLVGAFARPTRAVGVACKRPR